MTTESEDIRERLASAETLIADIHRAFPAKRDRFIGKLSNGACEEQQAVVRDFDDKDDWTKIDPDWLNLAPEGLGSASSFLSAAALRFYLPAYLLADIHLKLTKIADPVFNLTHGFGEVDPDRPSKVSEAESWKAQTKSIWADLNSEQVNVIVNYLEWAALWDDHNAEDIQPALREYWYPRQAETLKESR